MTPPTLTGTSAVLVPLALQHAASLQRHADDERVWQTLFEGFPRPYTLADANAWCGGGWRAAGVVWGIAVRDEVIGCVGVRQDAGWLRCNAEVGYWIGRQYWGKGIATEALRMASDWAFSEISDVTRLYAPIVDWNVASQAVARKAGFELEEADATQRDQGWPGHRSRSVRSVSLGLTAAFGHKQTLDFDLLGYL